jgi:hypothetical protein
MRLMLAYSNNATSKAAADEEKVKVLSEAITMERSVPG